jgi:hypothetical protein
LNQQNNALFSLILSAIGGLFLSVLIVQTPISPSMPSLAERIIISGMFIMLCLLGMSLSLRPNWIKTMLKKKEPRKMNQQTAAQRSFIGHHPDCSVFDTHRIKYKKRIWCAGCVGVLIGCGAAIVLMTSATILSSQHPLLNPRALFFLGLLLVGFVFVELLLNNRFPLFHTISNSLFIIAFFFVVEGVVEYTKNGIYGFFTILICFLWLDTRIHLSQWRHNQVCQRCKEPCKMYPADR